MRYTTLLDITEFPYLYRNRNVRLCYLHLVLKSGYHDSDRDLIEISIRRLADDVGITMGAARHALKVLKVYELIDFHGTTIEVKKWLIPDTISPRTRSTNGKSSEAATQVQLQKQLELEKSSSERSEYQRRLKEERTTGFMLFFEQKYKDYMAGDGSQLASLRRNISAYLSQCKQLKRKPIITAI